MKEDYLNTVTAKLKNSFIDNNQLRDELEKVNTFRKIRLAYALKFRTHEGIDSILYRIRNGKGYADEFSFNNHNGAKTTLNIVLDSIASDIEPNVNGKKIYIPEHITYALPATEKQFTGQFPSGTCVTISKDLVFGIHWDNVEHNRIDLDLATITHKGKIGWDSAYRNDAASVLFSGDVTDARDGASELFYVKRQAKTSMIMTVNYYNYDKDTPVPYKIIVAKEQVSNMRKNYMVDPNNVVAVSNSIITRQQTILGLIVVTTEECRFYFTQIDIGKNITSSLDDNTRRSREYLFNFYEKSIDLNTVLEKAGAVLVDEIGENVIDLSPESLEKDSILNLLK